MRSPSDPALGKRSASMTHRRNPQMNILSSFLRFFFRHLYTTIAWTYDLVAAVSSIGQWGAWQRVALDALPQEGSVLELGHGPGHLLKHRASQGKADIGVDTSRQMTRIAARRLLRAGLTPGLVRAQAQALPFASRSFAAIYATFPSEFIVAPQALASIRRVLADDGSLVVVPTAHITGSSLPDRFAAWLYRVTGESLHFSAGWDRFLMEAGFSAELERVELPRALVYRIIARKRQT
jgi:ubiquinone/menaquinone biosynthesis C-methylase UbiE